MRCGLLVLLASHVAFADEAVDPCACSPNKPHFHVAKRDFASTALQRDHTAAVLATRAVIAL